MPFRSTRLALAARTLLALAAVTPAACAGTANHAGGSSEPGSGGDDQGQGGAPGGRPGAGGRPETMMTGGMVGAADGGEPGGVDAGGPTADAMAVDAMAADAMVTGPDDGGPPPIGGPFRHPGILVNKAQLAFIRDRVKAGAQPQKAAYDKAMAELGSLSRKATPYATVECGPYSSPDIGCSPEIDDASAAYILAIAWNVTGDEAYAKKAIEVMSAWSHTLKAHTNHNAPLQTGWAGAVWPVAAEIIKHTYTGWAQVDQDAFAGMLKNAYLPILMKGSGGNGNWELVMIEAAFEIAVFLDDHDTFNQALAMWKKRVPAYLYTKSDGPNPPPPPIGGKGDTPEAIKAFWFNVGMYVDGVGQETCRDFSHVEYGIASAVAVAETAFQQGIDLYKEHATRLSSALEFHATYIFDPAPAWLCGGHPDNGPTRLMPTFEIGYNHYHDRMGMNLPNTLKLITSRVRGIEASRKHIVWETLTHAGAGWAGLK